MERQHQQTWKHLLRYGILRPEATATTGKKIVVCECFVAGIAHNGGEARLQELFSGQPLVLCRESDNAFDVRAVALYTAESTTATKKLGYVPRTNNTQPALLLDQHLPLGAHILRIDTNAPLHRAVSIVVYNIVPHV